jgi:hypothetical protein
MVFVVTKIDFRKTHHLRRFLASPVGRRAAIEDELRLDARAYDLLRRDAIDLFRPRAHKLDTTARDDKGLESMGVQVAQQ